MQPSSFAKLYVRNASRSRSTVVNGCSQIARLIGCRPLKLLLTPLWTQALCTTELANQQQRSARSTACRPLFEYGIPNQLLRRILFFSTRKKRNESKLDASFNLDASRACTTSSHPSNMPCIASQLRAGICRPPACVVIAPQPQRASVTRCRQTVHCQATGSTVSSNLQQGALRFCTYCS